METNSQQTNKSSMFDNVNVPHMRKTIGDNDAKRHYSIYPLASLGKEEDSNDSEEDNDTFDGFDDLRDCVQTDGDQVLVPDTIDSLVINDENGEIMKIPLTDRQRKKMEDRLNTFSERVKRQKEKAKLKTLFDPPMKQSQLLDQYEPELNNPHSIETRFQPQRHPKLEVNSSYHLEGKKKPISNMSRYQSSPNLISPELYNQTSTNKRIEQLKNQGKNIGQRFRNLFGVKPTRKNITISPKSSLGNNPNISSNEPMSIPPTYTSDSSKFYDSASSNHQKQYKDSSMLYKGIEAKYIKFNDSYRKAKKKSEVTRVQLIELLPIQPIYSEELSDFLPDFGAIFYQDNWKLKSITLRSNVVHYEELTKNDIILTRMVAILELVADLEEAFGIKYHVDMPRFKDSGRKSNPNLIFGGYLSYLHNLDRERNHNIECPSVLKHLTEYISLYGVREEGIFRITGSQNRLNTLKDEINQLYQNYYKTNKPDKRDEIFQIFHKYSPYEVAGLLKQFLRELRQPLFTSELLEIFLQVSAVPSLNLQIKILNLLMLLLNDSHRNSLFAILQLLRTVVYNQPSNKMSLEGVCTVMAPNLMLDQTIQQRSQPSPSLPSLMSRRMSYSSQSVNEASEEMITFLKRTTNSIALLKLLINLGPILFHVPPYIDWQIKYKSEQVKKKIKEAEQSAKSNHYHHR